MTYTVEMLSTQKPKRSKDSNKRSRSKFRYAWQQVVFVLILATLGERSYAESNSKDLFQMANYYLSKGKYQAAIFESELILKRLPKSADAYHMKGLCYWHLKQYPEALENFERASQLNPRISSIYRHRAQVYERIGDYQKALTDINRAIALGDRFPWAFTFRAMIKGKMGRDKEALADFEFAIAKDRKWSGVYLYRGDYYLNKGDKSSALTNYKQALQMAPESAECRAAVATVLLSSGRTKEARKEIQTLVKQNPNYHETQSLAGQLAILDGHFKEALQSLNKAIKLSPNSSLHYYTRGLIEQKLGQLDAASRDFDEAISRSPTNASYYKTRSLLNARTGNMEQALQDLVSCQGRATEVMSSSLLDRGAWQQVLKVYDDVLRLKPNSSETLYNRGVLRFALGDFKDASDDLSKFIEQSKWRGKSAIYAVLLASSALQRSRKKSQAAKLLEQSLGRVGSDHWERDLLRLNAGQIKPQQVQVIKGIEQQTVRRFYIGLFRLSKGNPILANQHFEWVRKNGDRKMDEFMLAIAELERQKKNPSDPLPKR